MSNGSSLSLCAALLLIASGQVSAQIPKELVHSVSFPEGDASWSVTMHKAAQPADGNAPARNSGPEKREIKKILIVQKGGMRRDTVTWSDGETTEYWWLPKINFVFFQTEAGGAVRKMRSSQMGVRQFDASTFSWVGKNTFVREENYKGKKCQAYEMQSPVAEGEKETFYAWIDQDTMEPVAWSDGITTASFAFHLPVPEEPLQMPEQIKKEVVRFSGYVSSPTKLGRQRVLR